MHKNSKIACPNALRAELKSSTPRLRLEGVEDLPLGHRRVDIPNLDVIIILNEEAFCCPTQTSV